MSTSRRNGHERRGHTTNLTFLIVCGPSNDSSTRPNMFSPSRYLGCFPPLAPLASPLYSFNVAHGWPLGPEPPPRTANSNSLGAAAEYPCDIDEYLGGFVTVDVDALKVDRMSSLCPAGTRVIYVGEVAFDSRDMNDIRSWRASAVTSTSLSCSAILLGRVERSE